MAKLNNLPNDLIKDHSILTSERIKSLVKKFNLFIEGYKYFVPKQLITH